MNSHRLFARSPVRHPRRPWIGAVLCLIVSCLVVPTTGWSAEKLDVFALLDSGDTAKVEKVSTRKLLRTLRKGRKYSKVKSGLRKTELADGHGRKTQLQLTVPKKPTGVIFLLHGLGGSPSQLVPSFQAFAATKGLIIAAPAAQKEPANKQNEDSNENTRAFPHWWSYHSEGFVLRALRDLKREFAIDENRVFLSGYSMGGFATWNLGLRYCDRFAAIVPMAGGISQHEYRVDRHDEIRKLLTNALHLPTYFLHGDADKTVPVRFDRASRDQLKRLGYEHEYVEVDGGGHVLDIRHGRTLLKGITSWLAKKRRNPHPKEVRFHCLGSYMSQCYWVRIDKLSSAGPGEVNAKITKNVIDVTTTGVAGLTLFIDDEVINLKKAVTIRVNGQERHSKKVKSSTRAMIESWQAREDRHLVYPASVSLEVGEAAGE